MSGTTIVFDHLGVSRYFLSGDLRRNENRVLCFRAHHRIPVDGYEVLTPLKKPLDAPNTLLVVEELYEAFFAGSLESGWLMRVVGSADVASAYRRFLLVELEALMLKLEAMVEAGLTGERRVIYETDSHFASAFVALVQERRIRSRLPGSLQAEIVQLISQLVVRAPRGLLLRGLLEDLVKSVGSVLKNVRRIRVTRHRRSIAIRTYPTDLNWGIVHDEDRLRNIDFLVDGCRIKPDDIVMVGDGPVAGDRIQMMTEKGYHYLDYVGMPYDIGFFVRRAVPALVSYVVFRLAFTVRRLPIVSPTRHFFQEFLRSQALAEYCAPRYWIAYNDLDAVSIIRNLGLSGAGCRTVFYVHACNWGYGPDGGWTPSTVFANLVYDVLVSWGPRQTAYHRDLHPAVFHDVWEVGALWSEHARAIREDTDRRSRILDRINSEYGPTPAVPDRTVGVLDTSIVNGWLTPECIFTFLMDHIQLARKWPNVWFLYKPKNPFDIGEPVEADPLLGRLGPKAEVLLAAIRETPNFLVLSRFFETGFVVGLSDVVVSAIFSSPTVEAIGCGVSGVFYDPTGIAPEKAFWKSKPGMVCKNSVELESRLQELLFESTEEDRLAYLRRYCSDIEGHFDGRGITRFREELSKGLRQA